MERGCKLCLQMTGGCIEKTITREALCGLRIRNKMQWSLKRKKQRGGGNHFNISYNRVLLHIPFFTFPHTHNGLTFSPGSGLQHCREGHKANTHKTGHRHKTMTCTGEPPSRGR